MIALQHNTSDAIKIWFISRETSRRRPRSRWTFCLLWANHHFCYKIDDGWCWLVRVELRKNVTLVVAVWSLLPRNKPKYPETTSESLLSNYTRVAKPNMSFSAISAFNKFTSVGKFIMLWKIHNCSQPCDSYDYWKLRSGVAHYCIRC